MSSSTDFTPVDAAARLFMTVAKSLQSDALGSMPDPVPTLPELWNLMCKRSGLEEEEITAIVAKAINLPPADFARSPLRIDLALKIPEKLTYQHCFAPIGELDGHLVLAVANPFDESINPHIQFLTGMSCRMHLATPMKVLQLLDKLYDDKPGDRTGHLNLNTQLQHQKDSAGERQLPRLARQLLVKALENNASDIHVQPVGNNIIVRIRVDGVLQRLAAMPEVVGRALIRFFKAQGSMDPTNQMIPQDGRLALTFASTDYDLRLSVLPVSDRSEKLVIRILNRNVVSKLAQNGFSLDSLHRLRRLLDLPNGLILMCGPTGSGKTTTLYSMLQEINSEEISITTVENPVEYHMAGLSQTEVNEKAGMTFPSALRSILRQDPDVILIGEIRDKQTAEIALQSALTGHLVLSTLHTNDSIGAIPRLMDFGISTTILAEALAGIVSQRLVRRLCEACRAPVADPLLPEEQMFRQVTNTAPAFRKTGCQKCSHTGYHGRQVVIEMIEPDQALKEAISRNVSDVRELLDILGSKFESLALSASRLVISGITTAEEAVRVLGNGFWERVAREYGCKVPDNILTLNSDAARPEARRMTVLLTGDRDSFNTELLQAIESGWLGYLFAATPHEAGDLLRKNDKIHMVILALPADADNDTLVTQVAEWRTAMAWSRLPALLLLPSGHAGLDTALRAGGATSRFLPADADTGAIMNAVTEALSRNLDFKWGLE